VLKIDIRTFKPTLYIYGKTCCFFQFERKKSDNHEYYFGIEIIFYWMLSVLN